MVGFGSGVALGGCADTHFMRFRWVSGAGKARNSAKRVWWHPPKAVLGFGQTIFPTRQFTWRAVRSRRSDEYRAGMPVSVLREAATGVDT